MSQRLPEDVTIVHAGEAPAGFHASLDAEGKRYRYRLLDSELAPVGGMRHPYCWHVRWSLDLPAMNSAAAHLVGTHDFQAFAGADADRPTEVTVVTVLPDTPAESAGLQAGDVLTRVDETRVLDPRGALNAIARVKPGTSISLGILRGGAPMELDITVAQRPQEG